MSRFRPRGARSTPPGEHRPIMLTEILDLLSPQPGEIAVDCTVGWGGHAVEILNRLGPTGRLIGLDLDSDNLPKAQERLQTTGCPFSLHHSNFAALDKALATDGVEKADLVLADLGMSSMQVDDPERGFSYRRDGPLDMRMDRTRGKTAAQLLATISESELRQALVELGDEPEAEKITAAIMTARTWGLPSRTLDLAKLIQEALPAGRDWRLHPSRERWQTHPAARTFQVLRILVNRELASLDHLLRLLPALLRSGGRAAILSFHSGEDRLVKSAFREGHRAGIYSAIAEDAARAGPQERFENPRSRSAKLRWARRA